MAYAYNADIWCDDCGEEIKSDLAGVEDSGDTDDYPQWCDDNEEADGPQHCSGCGVFLENALTIEGVDYVREIIASDLAAGLESVAIAEWLPYYDTYYDVGIDEDEEED